MTVGVGRTVFINRIARFGESDAHLTLKEDGYGRALRATHSEVFMASQQGVVVLPAMLGCTAMPVRSPEGLVAALRAE